MPISVERRVFGCLLRILFSLRETSPPDYPSVVGGEMAVKMSPQLVELSSVIPI